MPPVVSNLQEPEHQHRPIADAFSSSPERNHSSHVCGSLLSVESLLIFREKPTPPLCTLPTTNAVSKGVGICLFNAAPNVNAAQGVVITPPPRIQSLAAKALFNTPPAVQRQRNINPFDDGDRVRVLWRGFFGCKMWIATGYKPSPSSTPSLIPPPSRMAWYGYFDIPAQVSPPAQDPTVVFLTAIISGVKPQHPGQQPPAKPR
ncbi:hypothetical protein BDN72DRAFT_902924 [Pluteus cervinus]|uniref:Uncharacterized protein n=1 Tax=Pluteus cervinus TaxID=181527 RepID=A0ACD3AAZ7_9AGAR|nr:hypothetical protein BDN72DRAFT_902924 [Pluteus cervinus]